MLLDQRHTLLAAALLLATAACTADTVRTDAGPQPGEDAATESPPDAGPVTHPDAAAGADAEALARSEKARVRWKGEPILRSELATALQLPVADVCNELGSFDCFAVHRVALGGVEPYSLGINEPFPDTAVTAPLAIERVALSGCRTRVDLDLGLPAQAVIFKDIPGTAIADIRGAPVSAAIDRLYARFTSRRASPEETRALVDLYADVAASGDTRPGRAWAILSCFAVATSIESLFY